MIFIEKLLGQRAPKSVASLKKKLAIFLSLIFNLKYQIVVRDYSRFYARLALLDQTSNFYKNCTGTLCFWNFYSNLNTYLGKTA